jgi:two-component system NtrC family sensor kinase
VSVVIRFLSSIRADWRPGLRQVLLGALLGVGLPTAAQPQIRAADSLRAELRSHTRPDTARNNLLNNLALALRNNDPEESSALFRAARQLGQELGYAAGEAEASLGLGFYYRHRSEYGTAEAYSEQARQGFEQAGDRMGQTRSLYNLSCIYSEQGLYNKSLQANLRGLALAEAERNLKWQAFLNTQLGISSTYLGEYATAMRYLSQGLRMAKESNDPNSIGHAYAGMGALYRMQGRWADAQRNYEADAEISRQLNDEPGMLSEEINIGDMEERQGHLPQAFANGRSGLRRALRMRSAAGDVPRAQLVLARTFLRNGQLDSAVIYAQRSLRATQQSGAKEYSRDASEVLAKASARLGNFAAAYRYEKLFGAYRDSLNSSDLKRRAAVLEYRADLAKKQAQIVQLTSSSQLIQAQNRQQRWALLSALLGLGAAGGLSVVLWRNNREKQRANAQLKQQQEELKAAQTQLVAAEKWAFVGELSAGIAHELQNPLAFMKNFADVSVALLDTDGAIPAGPTSLEQEIMAGLKQNLQKISQQGQRASSIINDMLAHARSGRSERAPADLNALAAEALHLAYQGVCAQDETFHATLVQNLPPRQPLVAVAATDISRVLLNLCTNALHAVRERQRQQEPGAGSYLPTVTVSTRHLAPHSVEIRVRDNGTGMPVQVRSRIFQPFFTTKPAGEGTGLGLSLSHDIVTKGHGGTLAVESEEGTGSEFVVTLPVA